jgi:hypothetical protein
MKKKQREREEERQKPKEKKQKNRRKQGRIKRRNCRPPATLSSPVRHR